MIMAGESNTRKFINATTRRPINQFCASKLKYLKGNDRGEREMVKNRTTRPPNNGNKGHSTTTTTNKNNNNSKSLETLSKDNNVTTEIPTSHFPQHLSETHASFKDPQELHRKSRSKSGYSASTDQPQITESQASYQNPYQPRKLPMGTLGHLDKNTSHFGRFSKSIRDRDGDSFNNNYNNDSSSSFLNSPHHTPTIRPPAATMRPPEAYLFCQREDNQGDYQNKTNDQMNRHQGNDEDEITRMPQRQQLYPMRNLSSSLKAENHRTQNHDCDHHTSKNENTADKQTYFHEQSSDRDYNITTNPRCAPAKRKNNVHVPPVRSRYMLIRSNITRNNKMLTNRTNNNHYGISSNSTPKTNFSSRQAITNQFDSRIIDDNRKTNNRSLREDRASPNTPVKLKSILKQPQVPQVTFQQSPYPTKIMLFCCKGIMTIPSPTDVIPNVNSFGHPKDLIMYQKNTPPNPLDQRHRFTVNMTGFLDEDIYFFLDKVGRKLIVEGRRNGRRRIEAIDLPVGLDPDNLRVARDYHGKLLFEEAWIF